MKKRYSFKYEYSVNGTGLIIDKLMYGLYVHLCV